MSQSTVYKFLKKNKGKWFKTGEISKAVKVTCASQSLKQLFKYGEIRRKSKNKGWFGNGTYVWSFKD